MKKHALDIETAALPLAQIAHLRPAFSAPGNYKDPAKIADYVEEQARKWLENAALSPLTGRVLVVGIKPFGESPTYLEGDEKSILQETWNLVAGVAYDKWYGHGLHGFDLPFLVKRSWLHGIEVPMGTLFGESGYVNSRRFIDTMVAFKCGDRGADWVGLDTVAKFFGMPGKTEDLGPIFAQTYATDRPRALAYLARDLDSVEAIATRMFP